MIIKKIIYPTEGEYYNNALLLEENAGVTTVFGTVFLKKGTRIPEEGFTTHPFNEISIITEGCIEMLNEDGTVLAYLRKGAAVFIKASEAQAGNVLEDTKLIYVLNQRIEKNENN